MAKDFPISLDQFLPMLDVLNATNKYIGKLGSFLEKYGRKGEFPVKLHVPIFLTIYLSLLC